MTGDDITVTREQQEELDPVLGKAMEQAGEELADLVMEAYKIGRRHGREDKP